jgi:hypothetical protein
MDNSKYFKYKKNIISYLNIFSKKIDILQLGCHNIEVSKIFLEHLNKKKSSIIFIDKFIRDRKHVTMHNFQKSEEIFYKTISDLHKEDNVTIIKNEILNELENMIKDKTKLFDIIFIDLSFNENNLLYKILLSWKLLKQDGIIIFDTYNSVKSINKKTNPSFIIQTFITIYEKDIINLTDNNNFIVLQKNKQKIKKEEHINTLISKLIDFEIPQEEYELDPMDIETLDWNAEYYKKDEGENEPEQNIKDNGVDIKNFNNFIIEDDYDYRILDFNYLLQIKNKSFEDFKKYLNDLYKYNSDNVIFLLNFFVNKESIMDLIILDSLKYIQNKNEIILLRFGSKKSDSISINKFYNYFKNIHKKYILYNISNKFENNINININNNITYLYNDLKNYKDFKTYKKYIKHKNDIILFTKYSYYTIDNLNIKNIYLYNNIYLNLLYLFLFSQKKHGYILISLYINYTNIFYQILYILNLYYEKIIIKYIPIEFSLTNRIRIICLNFKGINKNDLKNIENICKNMSNNNNIKSLFNKNIESFKKKINIIIFDILKSKIDNYNNKYNIISILPTISKYYKNKLYSELFKKQLLYFFKIKNNI